MALGAFRSRRPSNKPGATNTSHNAPYGARCFLTEVLDGYVLLTNEDVLMHLMVLGAF